MDLLNGVAPSVESPVSSISLDNQKNKERSVRAAQKSVESRANGFLPHVASSETEYSQDQLDFMRAVEAFKKKYRRRFPTLSEYLMIAESIGWKRDERIQPDA